MNMMISKKNLYGSIKVYSPDNIYMFTSNENRLKFYFKNNLIEKVEEDKYKLLFTPKGLGYGDKNSWVNTGNHEEIIRKNLCVVTGETNLDLLTKHHIVPTFFRNHFSPIDKANFQLIVLITRKEHNKYNSLEQGFYDVLSKKYNCLNKKDLDILFNEEFLKPTRQLKTTIKHIHKIPIEELLKILANISDKSKYFSKYPIILRKILNDEKVFNGELTPDEYNFGFIIASKIIDFKEFEFLWLKHFIETMQPKFLPDDLITLFDKLKRIYEKN